MEEINGYVDHIIYHNDSNGYTVLQLSTEVDDITCTGTFPSVSQGENLLVKGEFVDHPTYGVQFKVESYTVKEPEDAQAIERYLASGVIPGIGPALAKRIVKKFKLDTFRIMEEEPERLAEIKGISLRKAQDVGVIVLEKKEVRSVMMFLEKYGISGNLALKIYDEYGPRTYEIVESNPYKMAEDISGVGFKRVDEIAMNIGIKVDSQFRIRSGILYALTEAAGFGHTFLPKTELMTYAFELLKVEIEDIDIHIKNLEVDGKVVVLDDNVYLTAYFNMEKMSAKMLLSLQGRYDFHQNFLDEYESQLERDSSIKLDDKQKEAVKMAVESSVCVLTGGPGTGKTTIIKAILRMLEMESLDVALCAPTGRAAKRMSEATGYAAKTIHRLLEVSGAVDEAKADEESAIKEYTGMFGRNAMNPLEVDVVIVDEASMVDQALFYYLLSALPQYAKLILVGDANQLPSVGAGNVLSDIIESQSLPVVMLDKIFRQAALSDIVNNAHLINAGRPVDLDKKSDDFYFVKLARAEDIMKAAVRMIKGTLPEHVEASWQDIQVITPTRQGVIGVGDFNKFMQEHLNPPAGSKAEVENLGRFFRVGDKVMQIKNNYQLEWEIRGRAGVLVESGTGVFNGDMGIITNISSYSKEVEVEYDEGRKVIYPFKGLDEIEHAYAITIHKSQGSEYPAVIIPLLAVPRPLINRNLLYTAVTRAKKCVILIGLEDVFRDMVSSSHIAKRYSSLADRLIEESE